MTPTDRAPRSDAPDGTMILTHADVTRLLSIDDCIEAVEASFVADAGGKSFGAGVLGVHAPGGGIHVKTAGIEAPTARVFAAKVNANFPGNAERWGLPTIQGIIALFDADNGRVLAVLDSIAITSLRTAAATAVAARLLARRDAHVVTIAGCGEQGRSQLRALARVRQLKLGFAYDAIRQRAEAFASDLSRELGIEIRAAEQLIEASLQSDICVTCTPASRWILGRSAVGPGTFVAAVGADSPTKQEIEPELMRSSTVVVDVLDQCATFGDLHHAIEAGVMRRADVYAELADIVSGSRPGRRSADEIIVFDSTGTALEDVAAAAVVFERAVAEGCGTRIDLSARQPGAMAASA